MAAADAVVGSRPGEGSRIMPSTTLSLPGCAPAPNAPAESARTALQRCDVFMLVDSSASGTVRDDSTGTRCRARSAQTRSADVRRRRDERLRVGVGRMAEQAFGRTLLHHATGL